MAKYIKPLDDFHKTFEIVCKNKKEVEEFENDDTIWNYEPFLDYMENFDDSYGYSISYNYSNTFRGGRVYCYNVSIYKIKN